METEGTGHRASFPYKDPLKKNLAQKISFLSMSLDVSWKNVDFSREKFS